MAREQFKSRLGFILISAGCAVGLGNVWRFPYIVGEYGGAAIVLLYLVFLAILGIPIMITEFAVGRASQKSMALAIDELEPKGSKWHFMKWVSILGLYGLMMFYTVVAGWMLAYVPKMAVLDQLLAGLGAGNSYGTMAPDDGTSTTLAQATGDIFNSMLADPVQLVVWMIIACVISLGICSLGLQKGVERITKVLMVGLLAIIVILVIRAITLDNAIGGIAFYLLPDFSAIASSPARFGEAVYAALGQAFFTLSIGIGSMEIFGSYIGKKNSLAGEAVCIAGLDTFVAITTGLIIFPACFAFGISPDSGPGLVFQTLPSVFAQMPLGNLWAVLFFILMSFAAISTVIAVFEGILAFWMDGLNMPRRQAVAINIVLIPLLSVPCALGFNIWSGFELPGIGNIQGIEDFLVSNNFLVIGSFLFVLFAVSKRGWGWDNFLAEANAGEGLKLPRWIRPWMKYGIPAIILIIFIAGWVPLIQTWLGG